VVAQPLRRAETLALYSGSCVAPLRLGRSASGSGKERGTWHGAQDVFRRGRGNGMIVIDEVKCIFIIGNFNAIEVLYPSFTHRSGQFKIVGL
jgi:hypothetical protein